MAHAKVTFNDEVLAESDQAILVEGNLYFPPDSVKWEYLKQGEVEYTCPWKGQARFYNVVVKEKTRPDAAWEYYDPSQVGMPVKDHVAFDDMWLRVEGTAAGRLDHP
jgi:uncharacterized protein (DUF427 family)